ncbi:MAG: outer membrane protein assembly factor BamB [Granulosicoccus sp.]|jgi:outer membrane protein assembly factor BamB
MRGGLWVLRHCLWLGLFSLCINSCSDEDEQRPEIRVTFPSAGAYFEVLDTIRVGLEITDDRDLEYVEVKLLDENARLSSSVATEFPSGAVYSGIMEITTSDKYLQSGSYIINIKIFDGTNERFEFIRVSLGALPKNRKSLEVITGEGNVSAYSVDSLGQVSLRALLPHDAGSFCIDNRHDQGFVIGNVDGEISSLDLENGGIVWENSWSNQPPAPAFLAVTCDNGDVLISGYDHIILGYNQNGDLILNKETTAAYRPQELIVVKEHLLVEQVQSGTNNHFMFWYNRESMAIQSNVSVPIDVVAITPLNEESVLIFGNDNGQARVFQYSYFENVIWEPRTLEPGSVIDAVKSNGNTYFIAQSDGIYAYTFLPNFLNFIVPSVVSTGLKFDTDRGVLLSSSSNMIQEYTTAGTLITTHQFSEDVVSFDFHYTK